MDLYDHSDWQDKHLRDDRMKRIALCGRLNALLSGVILDQEARCEVRDGRVVAM